MTATNFLTLNLPAALPRPIRWGAQETALVVVDMQNGFLKPDGYFDQVGYDLSHAPGTIERVRQSIVAARAAGKSGPPEAWSKKMRSAAIQPARPNFFSSSALLHKIMVGRPCGQV